ncbi:MAG: hypothetical protein KGI33_03220 [Thaumarchaeota archaeon]|nr:hypothetical protein [Nitrososphaerota archaeon]
MFSVITGIFLPVRLLFYGFISAHWIGSLGMVSSVLLGITFLAYKNKLGWFGGIFVAQMTKTMKGKSGIFAVIVSVILIAYLGCTIVWIERGETVYADEKQVIVQMIFSNHHPSGVQVKNISAVMRGGEVNSLSVFSKFDQVMSMTYAIMNDKMGGWLVNLDTILLVEQFEVLGLIFFYREVFPRYFQKPLAEKVGSITVK